MQQLQNIKFIYADNPYIINNPNLFILFKSR